MVSSAGSRSECAVRVWGVFADVVSLLVQKGKHAKGRLGCSWERVSNSVFGMKSGPNIDHSIFFW